MIVDILMEIFNNYYVVLFLFSFLASTLIPLGSEWFVYYLVGLEYNILYIVLIATIGNYLGAVINYYIGIKGGNTILHKAIKFNDKEIDKASRSFKNYGPVILFFSWLPIIGDPLTFVAGVLKYNFKKFTFYVLLGKMIRYIVIALVIYGFIG